MNRKQKNQVSSAHSTRIFKKLGFSTRSEVRLHLYKTKHQDLSSSSQVKHEDFRDGRGKKIFMDTSCHDRVSLLTKDKMNKLA